MSTLTTNPFNVSRETKTGNSNFIANLWETAEYNRFGIIAILLAVMAILGGLAGAVAIQDGYVKLLAVALATAFVEAMIISVASMRLITIASILALLVDLLVIIF